MTFYDAIVPVCLELYAKGHLKLRDCEWGFEYSRTYRGNSIEDIIDINHIWNWNMFCAEAKKAAAIIKNSPLYEELK